MYWVAVNTTFSIFPEQILGECRNYTLATLVHFAKLRGNLFSIRFSRRGLISNENKKINSAPI
jgi:hypothetical protein